MKVFVSWSKEPSRSVARALKDWLPNVIQTIEPWVSTDGIAKGQRWSAEIADRLEESGQGIVCVTRDNMHEPWLNFEAGALAKSLTDARVRPLLLDVAPHEVTGPLAQFQGTVATSEDDMLQLVLSLRESCAPDLDAALVTRAFRREWPDFAAKVRALLDATEPEKSAPSRPVEDLTAEILDRVRSIERTLAPASGRPDRTDEEIAEFARQLAGSHRVRHPEYGLGTVRRIGQQHVTVDFDDPLVGTQAFKLRNTRLVPVPDS